MPACVLPTASKLLLTAPRLISATSVSTPASRPPHLAARIRPVQARHHHSHRCDFNAIKSNLPFFIVLVIVTQTFIVMSYSYDRYEKRTRQSYGASSRRTTFGYWVPLALTVTVATIGLAAWIWKERSDDDDDYDKDRKDPRPPPGSGDVGPGNNAYAPSAQPPPHPPPHPPPQSRQVEEAGMVARMSGALRRTPSPQQIFDEASRRVVAGVTAAGAAVGGALSSIQEEDKGHYEDHSRWSEEAAARAGMAAQGAVTGARGQPSGVVPGGAQIPFGERAVDRRKTIAIVVSAEMSQHGHGLEETAYYQEHAVSSDRLPTSLSYR